MADAPVQRHRRSRGEAGAQLGSAETLENRPLRYGAAAGADVTAVAEAVARRWRADRRASATWLGWVHQPRLRASTSRYSKRISVGPSGGPAFAFVANSRNSRSRFALRSGSSSTLANAATTGPKVRL
jgi:hypothetical protein